MSGPLKIAWEKREQQMAESDKLYAESDKLYADADTIWIDTVIEAHGKDAHIEWTANGCKVNGELFRYKEAK